jgi:hypothetical protein
MYVYQTRHINSKPKSTGVPRRFRKAYLNSGLYITYYKVPDGFVTKTRRFRFRLGLRRLKTGVKDLGNGYFKDIYEI